MGPVEQLARSIFMLSWLIQNWKKKRSSTAYVFVELMSVERMHFILLRINRQ